MTTLGAHSEQELRLAATAGRKIYISNPKRPRAKPYILFREERPLSRNQRENPYTVEFEGSVARFATPESALDFLRTVVGQTAIDNAAVLGALSIRRRNLR